MSRRKHTPLCHQQHSPFLACSILEPREHESGVLYLLSMRCLLLGSSPAQSLGTAGSVMTIGLSAINGILYLKKKQFDERKPD